MGSFVNRYSPRASVTVETDGTWSDGLVAVTVTPGITLPLSSVTTPMIAVDSWAMALEAPPVENARNNRTTAGRPTLHVADFTGTPPSFTMSATAGRDDATAFRGCNCFRLLFRTARTGSR